MELLTVEDLRAGPERLLRGAEQGQLSVVTRAGQPVFVAVPFDEVLLRHGVGLALALKLYQDKVATLAQAARLAGMGTEAFLEETGRLHLPLVDYPAEELDGELASLESMRSR